MSMSVKTASSSPTSRNPRARQNRRASSMGISVSRPPRPGSAAAPPAPACGPPPGDRPRRPRRPARSRRRCSRARAAVPAPAPAPGPAVAEARYGRRSAARVHPRSGTLAAVEARDRPPTLIRCQPPTTGPAARPPARLRAPSRPRPGQGVRPGQTPATPGHGRCRSGPNWPGPWPTGCSAAAHPLPVAVVCDDNDVAEWARGRGRPGGLGARSWPQRRGGGRGLPPRRRSGWPRSPWPTPTCPGPPTWPRWARRRASPWCPTATATAPT